RLRALTSLAAASLLIGLSACAPEDGQQTRPTPQAAETIGASASPTEQPVESGEPSEPTDGAPVDDAGAAELTQDDIETTGSGEWKRPAEETGPNRKQRKTCKVAVRVEHALPIDVDRAGDFIIDPLPDAPVWP